MKPECIFLKDDGVIPNNPDLPVLLYFAVFRGKENQIERTFNENEWRNSWTGGVYDYHHYHSNSHEALGVISGSAAVMIGGEKGQKFNITAGDVLILPAGTGHKRLEASNDFQITGAYPGGMDYNLKTGKPGERPGVLEEILNTSIPVTDPVFGSRGPLLDEWKQTKNAGE